MSNKIDLTKVHGVAGTKYYLNRIPDLDKDDGNIYMIVGACPEDNNNTDSFN